VIAARGEDGAAAHAGGAEETWNLDALDERHEKGPGISGAFSVSMTNRW
jgi:hypothetical protein